MHRVNSSAGRMLWLLSNEIRIKKAQYILIILAAFGLLTFFYFNPGFSFTRLFDSIINPNQSVTSNGRTVFFNSFIGSVTNTSSKFHLDYFPNALILVSTILTSLSFSEYSDENNSRFYISLPARTIEKWVVKAFWYILVFPLLFYLLYQLFAQVSYGWDNKNSLVRVPFLDPYIWRYIFINIGVQITVFVGALFFRKYSAIKFILFAFGLYQILIIIRNLLVANFVSASKSASLGSIFSSSWWKSYLTKEGLTSPNISFEYPFLFDGFVPIVTGLFLALFMLHAGYLRFQEFEA